MRFYIRSGEKRAQHKPETLNGPCEPTSEPTIIHIGQAFRWLEVHIDSPI